MSRSAARAAPANMQTVAYLNALPSLVGLCTKPGREGMRRGKIWPGRSAGEGLAPACAVVSQRDEGRTR